MRNSLILGNEKTCGKYAQQGVPILILFDAAPAAQVMTVEIKGATEDLQGDVIAAAASRAAAKKHQQYVRC